MSIPYAVVRVGRVDSTQSEARGRFAGEPVLVVADRQHAGRGRSGRRWVEADRGLYASLAFTPARPPHEWTVVPLWAGLSARSALDGRPQLKWPNDLVLGPGRKVGGILVEAAGGELVAGLGVNLWWRDPVPGAVALHADDPGPDAAVAIAERWAASLLRRVVAPEGWREEYSAACTTLGMDITWRGDPPPGRGIAVGIDADGALLVDTAAGPARLLAGEVREVRTATLGGRLP